jgi:hypothetical protein
MKRVKGLLITAAFTLGLLAAALWAWNHHGWWLARHWANQLQQAPEDRLDGLLECIVRLGEPGIPALIEALASARSELAERASDALDDEIERWKTLPAAAAAPRLTALSRGLASRVEQFGPQTQQRAAAIAQRILVWPTDTTPGGTEVVRSCETVLRSVSARAETAAGSGAATHGTPGGSNKDGLRICDTVLRMDSPMLSGASTPPAPTSAETAAVPGASRTGYQPVPAGEPRPLGASSSGRPPRHLLEGNVPLGEEEGGEGPSPRGPSVANGPAQLSPMGGPAASNPAVKDDTFAIIRRLQAEDRREVAEAEAELKRRGFGDRELGLARRWFDPDPQARRRLARLLPEMPGLDAVPWLLELSRDADAEVRLTALTLLATTGDPDLVEKVQELARGDPDPRFQRLAERLAPPLK